MKRYRASIIYVLVFTSLVLIDQTTKIFSINKTITIIPNILRIIYTKNYGGALGVFNNKIVVAVDIMIIIVLLVFWIKSQSSKKNTIGLIILMAGSIGNLIDRICRGYVIDFIKLTSLPWVPIINFSDIFIVIGLIIFIISIINNK